MYADVMLHETAGLEICAVGGWSGDYGERGAIFGVEVCRSL